MPSRTLLPVALLLACVLFADSPLLAGKFYWHRQRVETKRCLPDHDYERVDFARKVGMSVIAVAPTNPTPGGRPHKSFHFRARALSRDHLTLEQMGATLSKAGQLLATAKITHRGGNGGVIGSNVTIRVRAFAAAVNQTPVPETPAVPSTRPTEPEKADAAPDAPTVAIAWRQEALEDRSQRPLSVFSQEVSERLRRLRLLSQLRATPAAPHDATRIPPDALAVWEGEHTMWVPRGGPALISLVPAKLAAQDTAKLKAHYQAITHLEVHVDYHRDR